MLSELLTVVVTVSEMLEFVVGYAMAVIMLMVFFAAMSAGIRRLETEESHEC